jgi:predicted membrane channel-forming protein YqfA (hemolysin III family)
MVLIVPAAIMENLKLGYSTMKVMYRKIFYSLLTFLVVGLVFGIALAGWYYERFMNLTIPRVSIAWYVLVSIGVLLLIELGHIFTMLKAVKREFMQFDE